ncbi:MAG: AAA family ATPase [Dehalococcoidia bacterium]
MFLLQMAGEPGAGKSTLARSTGKALGAAVLDKDVLKSAILDAGASEHLAGPAAYACMFAQAEHLLGQGFSVILDSPSFYERIPRTGVDISARLGAEYRFMCCVCEDGSEILRRLTTREQLRTQPRQPVSPETKTVFPDTPYLVVDTRQSRARCLALALAYLRVCVGRG